LTPEEIIKFYIDQGFSLIPIVKGKKFPAIEGWKKYQSERATYEEARAWWGFATKDDFDIAIVCGEISGNLVVVDFDDPKLYHKAFGKGTEKSTTVVKTSMQGRDRKRHVYFRTKWPVKTMHLSHKGVAIDIQGEGSYVKAVPSLRDEKTGLCYEFERDELVPVKEWDGDFLADFMTLLKENIDFDYTPEKVSVKEILEPCSEGGRHDRLVRITAWFKNCRADRDTALERVLEWNSRNEPPLPEGDVTYQFATVFDREDGYSYQFDEPPRKIYSAEVLNTANKVLNDEDPYKYAVNAIHLKHVGDDELIKFSWTSFLCSHIETIMMNLWGIGESGTGKSHLFTTLLEAMPQNLFEIFTSTSPLSLFYYVQNYGEFALDKTLIYMDEVEASEQSLPMLRNLTGQTEITPRHLTVKDQEMMELVIRGKRSVWFTSVHVRGSDQIQKRFVCTNPDDGAEQDKRVFEQQDKQLRLGERPNLEAFEIIGAMTEVIIADTAGLMVKIPFAIDWPYQRQRRLYPIFLSTLKVSAKVNYRQRKIKDGKIIAIEEDFMNARRMWASTESSIIFRVAGKSMRVLESLSPIKGQSLTVSEISQRINISTSQVYRDLETLMTLELVNKDKRIRDGAGRGSWEFWLSEKPSALNASIAGKPETNLSPSFQGIGKEHVEEEHDSSEVFGRPKS